MRYFTLILILCLLCLSPSLSADTTPSPASPLLSSRTNTPALPCICPVLAVFGLLWSRTVYWGSGYRLFLVFLHHQHSQGRGGTSALPGPPCQTNNRQRRFERDEMRWDITELGVGGGLWSLWCEDWGVSWETRQTTGWKITSGPVRTNKCWLTQDWTVVETGARCDLPGRQYKQKYDTALSPLSRPHHN